MNEYIRTHRRKFLAVFGILLMISFVAFTGTPTTGPNTATATVGTIHGGKVKLIGREFQGYNNQLRFLNSRYQDSQLAALLGDVQAVSEEEAVRLMTNPELAAQLTGFVQMRVQNPMLYQMLVSRQPGLFEMGNAMEFGHAILAQFQQHADLYALRAAEAEAIGAGVNADFLNTLLANSGVNRETDPDVYDMLERSFRTLLKVVNASERVARAAKVKATPAERARFLATQNQQVSLNLVEFPAKDFLDRAPAPTEAELTEQFNKFKDVVSTGEGVVGYKYPNRVKYEAVEIKRDAVKKGIEPVDTADAYEFYLANRGSKKFESTTQPDAFSLEPGPAKPTTRLLKFEEAREQIVTELTDKRVAELTDRIRDYVVQAMKDDYAAFRAATPAPTPGAPAATAPVNPPATALGVPYHSKDYLAKLRDKIQADFKVTVAIEREEGWQTPTSLGESRLGKASYFSERGGSLVTVLTTRVEPLVAEAERHAPGALKPLGLYEPTPAMTDMAGDVLIARATAADPAHAPASLAEVREKVVADVKQVAAYQMAKRAAEAAVDQAIAQGKLLQTLAAADLKRPVVNTGLFTPSTAQGMVVPNYPVPATARATFATETTDLLTLAPRSGAASRPATTRATAAATTQSAATGPVALKDHPIGLIELPDQAKVLVAEVDQLKPAWSKQDAVQLEADVTRVLTSREAGRLRLNWFSYDEATRRMGYAPAEGYARTDAKKPNTLPRPIPLGL